MNSIYIGHESWENKPLIIPILDDFSIEARSEFKSFSELVPTIDQITNLLGIVDTSNGTQSTGYFNLKAKLDAQRWGGTDPIKISTTLNLFTKTNAYTDVIKPLNTLLGFHILRKDKDNKIHVPGVSASNIGKLTKTNATGKVSSSDKKANKQIDTLIDKKQYISNDSPFLSVLIPGVVYLEKALVYSIEPTYSKHLTKTGYPIWASAQVQFMGVIPAMIESFEQGANFAVGQQYSNIKV